LCHNKINRQKSLKKAPDRETFFKILKVKKQGKTTAVPRCHPSPPAGGEESPLKRDKNPLPPKGGMDGNKI
jgi:hypothetical protein